MLPRRQQRENEVRGADGQELLEVVDAVGGWGALGLRGGVPALGQRCYGDDEGGGEEFGQDDTLILAVPGREAGPASAPSGPYGISGRCCPGALWGEDRSAAGGALGELLAGGQRRRRGFGWLGCSGRRCCFPVRCCRAGGGALAGVSRRCRGGHQAPAW